MLADTAEESVLLAVYRSPQRSEANEEVPEMDQLAGPSMIDSYWTSQGEMGEVSV